MAIVKKGNEDARTVASAADASDAGDAGASKAADAALGDHVHKLASPILPTADVAPPRSRRSSGSLSKFAEKTAVVGETEGAHQAPPADSTLSSTRASTPSQGRVSEPAFSSEEEEFFRAGDSAPMPAFSPEPPRERNPFWRKTKPPTNSDE